MGLIQEEIKLSKTIEFEKIKYKDKTIVKLSKNNVAIAEAMIRNDSDYIVMYDTSAKGSGAYWLSKLKEVYEAEKRGKKTKESEVKEIIENAVVSIDIENSTHLNADKVGRKEISARILKVYKAGKLFDLLKNPGEEYALLNIIAEKTNPNDKCIHGRTNLSFASKFCHYASFFIFEGKKEQDNYSIWDSILRKAIPLYLDYYDMNLKEYNLMNYCDYQRAIADIIVKSGERISRNGFDHLLWYYYKGRIDK